MTNLLGNADNCYGTIGANNGTYIVDLDMANNLYSVYFNSLRIGNCYNNRIQKNDTRAELQRFYFEYGVDTNEYLSVEIDNIMIAFGSVTCSGVTNISTVAHILFSDDFDYSSSMYATKGWNIFTGSYSVDTSFTPIGNQLVLTSNNFISPSHQTGRFSVLYPERENQFIIESIYTPVVSSEMDLNLKSSCITIPDCCFRYAAYSGGDVKAYQIFLCPDKSAYYQQDPYNALNYTQLCTNCFNVNESIDLKITTFFSQKPGFEFNSTILSDHIDIYANNTLLGSVSSFLSPLVTNLQNYYIIKNQDSKFVIDNYAVFLGTDKNINNAAYYYKTGYSAVNESIGSQGQPSNDVANSIINMYDLLGLHSAASRVLAGLFLLFVIIIFVIALHISAQMPVSPITLVVTVVIGIIGITFLQLFPIWIPILIAIVVIGGAVMVILIKSSGSG